MCLLRLCCGAFCALCCTVLHCAAVYCSVLQCAAVCCSVLLCIAVCRSVLQCAAVCHSVLKWLAMEFGKKRVMISEKTTSDVSPNPKITGLFCRISSLLQGSFTKETYSS